MDGLRHAVLQDASEKYYKPAEAVALGKVLVRDGPSEKGDPEEPAADGHGLVIRIRQDIFRISGIVQSGKYKVCENSKAGTCPADGHSVFDPLIDRRLDRSTLPVLDVIGLISTGDKNGFSVADGVVHH